MPDKIDNPLDQYERNYCDCRKCTLACRHMPGSLAPGDLEKIAQYCGRPAATVSFVEEHFVASEGPIIRLMVPDPDGPPRLEDHHVPTIVPRQEEDGSCVFLDEEGHCMIHPVAPFGCRTFKVCDPPSEKDDEKSKAMLRQIVNQPAYLRAWKYLAERGLLAKPLLERRGGLTEALAQED